MSSTLLLSGKIDFLVEQFTTLSKEVTCSITDDVLQLSATDKYSFYVNVDSSDNSTNSTNSTNMVNIVVVVNKKCKMESDKIDYTYCIEGVTNYMLCFIPKGDTTISKKLKKTEFEHLEKLNDKYILYSINNQYLFTVDSSGFLNVYLDTNTVYNCSTDSINQFLDTIGKPHLTELPPLNTILSQCGYSVLDIEINPNSYNIDNADFTYLTNSVPTASTPTVAPTATEVVTQSAGIIGSIGYLASWLNPFSYYGSSPVQPVSTVVTTNLQSLESDNKESDNKDNTNSSPTSVYYVNDTSIIKAVNGYFKVLNFKRLDIPIHLEDIVLDTEKQNIKMSGKLDNKYNVDFVFKKEMTKYNVIVTFN